MGSSKRSCENCEKWVSLGSSQGLQYAFSEHGSCKGGKDEGTRQQEGNGSTRSFAPPFITKLTSVSIDPQLESTLAGPRQNEVSD